MRLPVVAGLDLDRVSVNSMHGGQLRNEVSQVLGVGQDAIDPIGAGGNVLGMLVLHGSPLASGVVGGTLPVAQAARVLGLPDRGSVKPPHGGRRPHAYAG